MHGFRERNAGSVKFSATSIGIIACDSLCSCLRTAMAAYCKWPAQSGICSTSPSPPPFILFPEEFLEGSASSHGGGATQGIEIPNSGVNRKIFDSNLSGHFRAGLAAPDDAELRFVAEI